MKQLPTRAELHALFYYNMETGRLHWRVPPCRKPHLQHQPAGSVGRHGYVWIKLNQEPYAHHRLVWVYTYGEDPGELEVDHINNVPGDDRLENLRLTTHKGNHQNRLATKLNGGQWKDRENGVARKYDREYKRNKRCTTITGDTQTK